MFIPTFPSVTFHAVSCITAVKRMQTAYEIGAVPSVTPQTSSPHMFLHPACRPFKLHGQNN